MAGCAHKTSAIALNEAGTGPWAGRISLQVQSDTPQAFFAGFELKGSAEQGELKLLSPIGSVLALMRWSPVEALLDSGSGSQRFASVDALLEQTTGAPIPTAALFDWLRGTNTQTKGWTADLARHTEGRITARRLLPAPAIDLRLVLDQ